MTFILFFVFLSLRHLNNPYILCYYSFCYINHSPPSTFEQNRPLHVNTKPWMFLLKNIFSICIVHTCSRKYTSEKATLNPILSAQLHNTAIIAISLFMLLSFNDYNILCCRKLLCEQNIRVAKYKECAFESSDGRDLVLTIEKAVQ